MRSSDCFVSAAFVWLNYLLIKDNFNAFKTEFKNDEITVNGLFLNMEGEFMKPLLTIVRNHVEDLVRINIYTKLDKIKIESFVCMCVFRLMEFRIMCKRFLDCSYNFKEWSVLNDRKCRK